MTPSKLSTIAVANSAGAFLFSVLFTVPVLAILLGLVSITTGIMAVRGGAPKGRSYVAIGLSVLWILFTIVFVIIRTQELGMLP